MKKNISKKAIKLTSAALAFSLAVSVAPFSVFAQDSTTITIYHTNDMHGNVEALANVKTLKDKTENSLLLDGGDATQGSSLATYTKGNAIVEIMNETGYDAMALGNHEFDFGTEKAIENMQNAEFTPLSANTYKANGDLVLNGVNGNGAYIIEEVDGKKIGIFGLTTEETAYKTNPKNLDGIKFDSIITTAKAQVALLQKQDVDAIVAVMHVGNDASSNPTSIDLAKQVEGIDLIIDGHSHTVINEQVGDTYIAQTGSNLKNLGEVKLNFKGDDLTIEHKLLDMETVVAENPADAEVTEVYNKYNAEVSEVLKEVIGNTTTDLYAFDENDVRVSRIQETPMGALIADSMVYGANEFLANTEYKDLPVVALQNGGGVRANIPAGDITLEDVFNVLPFGNLISMKVITPDKLYDALENGFSKMYVDENGNLAGLDGRYPQISGMQIELDLSNPAYDSENPAAGKGERVVAINLLNEDGSVTPLDRNDTTTEIVLASNDFVIAGGDGYNTLGTLKNIAEGEVLDQVLAEYIKKLTAEQDGSFTYNIDNNLSSVIFAESEKQMYKSISLDNFLYLTEDKEVELYSDIPEVTPPYWANESIYYFKALGLFENNANFYPNSGITYDEFSKMLEKLLGLESSDLKQYGLVGSAKTFNAEDKLTREEVSFILGNVVKAYKIDLPTKDVMIEENVSDYAKDNFEYIAEIGLINGDNNKMFNPMKNATKAEVSVMLYNLTNLFVE